MSRKWNISWFAAFVVFVGILAYLTLPTFSVGSAAKSQAAAPGFELADLTGKKVKLEDFPQKIKVLNFWATWCSACKMEIPALQTVQDAYKSQDVVVIGMSVDEDPNAVVRFVERSGVDYPMLVNAMGAAQEYHLRATPTTVILDEDNNVYKKYVGVQGFGTFKRDIEALLGS